MHGKARIVNPQNYKVAAVTSAWRGMNARERGQFLSLTAQMHTTPGHGLPPGVNAFNTFSQLSHARLQIGRPVTSACPPLRFAPTLPLLSLTAEWTNAGLTLHLTVDAAAPPQVYPAAVSVWGARPILAHQNVTTSTQFLRLGHIPAGTLGPTPIDVTPLFSTRYCVPSPGYRIALRCVGVTEDGFCSAEQFVWADLE